MKLIIIFGPHAVGKMTVGQSLSKLINIPLFHNHESIELALSLLGEENKWKDLSNEIREVVFKHVSEAKGRGVIFTFMWALDSQGDHEYIHYLEELFANQGGEVYYVELMADKDVRIIRNQTENRLREKPSKQDIKSSLDRFIKIEDKYRLNSYDHELSFKHYMKIDNTNLSPDEVANMIKEYFKL